MESGNTSIWIFGLAVCAALGVGVVASASDSTAVKARIAAISAEAEKADDADNYPLAAKRYLEALALAEDVTPDKAPQLKRSLADAYVNWARTLYWKAKTEKDPLPMARAIELCRKASEANPRLSRKCDVFIAKFSKDLKSLEYQKATSIDTIDPHRKERLGKVAVLLKQGAVLEKDGQFAQALDKYRETLSIDPYNLTAALRSRQVLKKIEEAGNKRAEADRQGRKADATWKYVDPIEVERAAAMQDAVREYESESDVRRKLDESGIPNLNFKDTPLATVFSTLAKEISKVTGEKFEFKYKGFNPSDAKWPPITFQASNIPPKDAVKAVCDATALDFKFHGVNEAELKPK
jgi:tetratricopeptide (TPR) repeat protein